MSAVAVEESNVLKCDLCDFSTSTQQGLKTHQGHKHKKQLCAEEQNPSLEVFLTIEERDFYLPLVNSSIEESLNISCETETYTAYEVMYDITVRTRANIDRKCVLLVLQAPVPWIFSKSSLANW